MKNWAGNVHFRAARLHRPASVDELRRLVAAAGRVHAIGTGHSFNRVADTDGDLVRLDALPAEVTVGAGTATVSAGLRYGAVAAELDRAGVALANLASLPDISVAGCCATGTHGSGPEQRCLADAVTAVELVGADGDLLTLRRGDADFPGSVVALGGLGVVTRLTLAVEPAYEVTQAMYADVPLDDVAGRVGEVFGAGYSVSLLTRWDGPAGAVLVKQRTDRTARPWTVAEPLPPGFSGQLELGAAGPWHQRLPHFRVDGVGTVGDELQSEYYLPLDAAPAAFAALRSAGDRVAAALHMGEVRTVRADDLWLSPAYGRDSVTIGFTWRRDEAVVLPMVDVVEELLAPLGARPHWGKITHLPPADVAAGYERAGDFARLRARLDPTGKFGNELLDAHF